MHEWLHCNYLICCTILKRRCLMFSVLSIYVWTYGIVRIKLQIGVHIYCLLVHMLTIKTHILQYDFKETCVCFWLYILVHLVALSVMSRINFSFYKIKTIRYIMTEMAFLLAMVSSMVSTFMTIAAAVTEDVVWLLFSFS